MAPDFDHLCLMQKLEVFEYSLDNTTGQDFYRVMWLKSRNSEAWLDRRNNYTRTLAVMSMVGHILGLGDRHPSNLLMDRVSGRIIHVDFGDCFEVAMAREVSYSFLPPASSGLTFRDFVETSGESTLPTHPHAHVCHGGQSPFQLSVCRKLLILGFHRSPGHRKCKESSLGSKELSRSHPDTRCGFFATTRSRLWVSSKPSCMIH